VDADTKVLPDALTYMIAAMANDITIMGLCGETRIANKRTSCKYHYIYIIPILYEHILKKEYIINVI
jgi:cellulose synthase/poly-beta-1,6-N-acetylglucosamine synthase-like glycosyltransferase